MAVDAKGDLFVSAPGNNSVEEFAYNSASGTYASRDLRGRHGSKWLRGQPAFRPHGVALDANGDLFVVDTGNDRVMEYTYNSATASYATTGTEIAASLPSGADFLALDASGDLFVSYGSASGGGVLEFAYNSATAAYASSGAAVGNVNNPASATGLAFNSRGDLFVAEATDLVLELVQTELLPTAAGFAPLGTIMGQQSVTNTGISSIALDGAGNLFVSDNLSSNGPAGVFEFPVNSTTGTYSLTGAVITKTGGPLAVDNNRDLFVAQGLGVLEYPWNSTSGSYPSSGSAVPGATELSGLTVTAMAFDGNNDLFVASGENVVEFIYNSVSSTWAASGNIIATVSPGTALVGGIAVDPAGDLFVSNPSASQVLEYEYNQVTATYPATGTAVAGVGGTGDALNQLNEPTALAQYSGNLFVFDAGNARVLEFSPVEGTVGYQADGTVVFSGNIDNNPENGGVAIGGQGNVFFGNDYNSAVVYEAANTPPTGVGGTTTTGTSPTSSPTTTTSSTTTTVAPTTTTTSSTTTTSVPPTNFPGWTAVTPPTGLFVGDFPPMPVSCAPGTTHCVAVLGSTSVVTVTAQYGQGVAVTSDLTNWSGYNSLPSQFFQVLSISCPTSTQCVAVGYGSTDNPVIAFSTNGGVSWAEANMSPFNPASGWPQGRHLPVRPHLLHRRGHGGAARPDGRHLDRRGPGVDGARQGPAYGTVLLPGRHLLLLGVELCGRRGALGDRSRHRHIDDVQRDHLVPVAVVRLGPARGPGVGVVPDRDDRLLRQRLSRELRGLRRGTKHGLGHDLVYGPGVGGLRLQFDQLRQHFDVLGCRRLFDHAVGAGRDR